MALEIEHKFLLKNDKWRTEVVASYQYKQGYLLSDGTRSIRVRISDNKAWLNIKSATIGNHRQEYEYEIPITDASEILTTLCERPFIEKTRHIVHYKQHTWEIDEFYGLNSGLIIAEIELESIDEKFSKPDWTDKEVTNDLRYYNNNLCKNPFTEW